MRLSLGAVVLAVCGVPLAWSPPTVGPTGGGVTPELDNASYSYDCYDADNRVLIGIRGYQGWWMDGVRGVCAQIRSDGTLNTAYSDRRYTRLAGGTGGRSYKTYVCPTGRVMVGYTGTGKTYVHTIRTITCQSWDARNRVPTGPLSSRTAFPVKGPGFYSHTLCQYGMVGNGISGKAGIYLDTFNVKCVYAPNANPPKPPPTIYKSYLSYSGGLIAKPCRRNQYGQCISGTATVSP